VDDKISCIPSGFIQRKINEDEITLAKDKTKGVFVF
tara:strand:+ start:358 stop:465 length:108 start_codon:yes stop_codon:yes gene_type:complete